MRAYALQSVAQRGKSLYEVINQKNISTPYYRNEGEVPGVEGPRWLTSLRTTRCMHFMQFARHQKLRREIDQVLTVEFTALETLLIFLCQTVRI